MGQLHNEDIERAVLGALLVSPALLDSVTLGASDFTGALNLSVWNAIKWLDSESMDIDLITVSERVEESTGKVDIPYISNLIECYGHVSSIDTYCRQLKEYTAQRNLHYHTSGIMEKMVAGEITRSEAIRRMDRAVTDSQVLEEERSNKDVVRSAMKIIGKAQKGELVRVTPTGYRDIDELCGGWVNNLNVVGAPSANGKSTFCDNSTIRMCEAGEIVGRITLEDTSEDVVTAMACCLAKVDNRKLNREGGLSEAEKNRLRSAFKRVESYQLYHSDTPKTITGVVNLIKRWRAKYGVTVVIVDHCSEIQYEGKSDRRIEVGALAGALRDYCKGKFPIILVSQLNRAWATEQKKNKEPQVWHLMDSSELEKKARLILLLWRPEYQMAMEGKSIPDKARGIIKAKVAKVTRGGVPGIADLKFIGQHNRIEDLNL